MLIHIVRSWVDWNPSAKPSSAFSRLKITEQHLEHFFKLICDFLLCRGERRCSFQFLLEAIEQVERMWTHITKLRWGWRGWQVIRPDHSKARHAQRRTRKRSGTVSSPGTEDLSSRRGSFVNYQLWCDGYTELCKPLTWVRPEAMAQLPIYESNSGQSPGHNLT